MTALRPFTLGTHNLLDGAGRVTPFADVILFTEFPVAKLARLRSLAKLARHGYLTISDARQPDLVIAAKRRIFARRGETYTHVVDGRPKVTPNRGTLVGLLEQKATRVPVAAVDSHRINAWYSPWIRGERVFREQAYRAHELADADLVERLESSGYRVVAGGDPNAPAGVEAYRLTRLHERGDHLDRVASRRIGPGQLLTKEGSDHHRLRAEVRA